MKRNRRPKILAISSSGGHWIQLLRLRPAFAGARVTYATVNRDAEDDVAGAGFYVFPDANRDRKLALMLQILKIAWIVAWVRPDVVITTGASCGYVAIRVARLLGSRTLFMDSIANAENMSLSAQLAKRHVNMLLTQWPHLADADGPDYHGSVI
jgi:UDP-N-acetylglucosamine:LPS N-acetylglucosamine transferase